MDEPKAEPEPEPPIEDDATAQLQAEIDEFEDQLNEAGIADAQGSIGTHDSQIEGLQLYRDDLAKRVGGE